MSLLDYLPRVQFDRKKWDESTAPVRGLLADLSPGYGDVLAAQRGAQAFNQAYGLLGQGEVLKGAGRAAEGLAEHLSVVPGVGELATLSKGAVSMLPGLLGMTAWHGSPYKFDRFDMSKIGTGEGAQAYGHGLYFAESPDVAKSYAPRDFAAEEKMMARYKQAEARGDYDEMEIWENAMMHETPADIRARYASKDYDDAMRQKAERVATDLQGMYTDAAHLYEVDIPDDAIAKMLDWDAPLSEQPEAVRKLAESLPAMGAVPSKQYWTGGDVYRALTVAKGGRPQASQYLAEMGYPGIRYLDGSSRSAGEGTRNFVLFDENLVKIKSRNGRGLLD